MKQILKHLIILLISIDTISCNTLE